jgi:hypothetical protein
VSAAKIETLRAAVYGAACALRDVSDEGDTGHVVGGVALSALDAAGMSGLSAQIRCDLLTTVADAADDLDCPDGDNLAAALDALAAALGGEG